MKNLKSYKELNEVMDIDVGFDLKFTDLFNQTDYEEIKKTYFQELGRSGELLRYLKARNYRLQFGMLKSLFKDAITYKRKRELMKGGYKFMHRIIPIAIGPFLLPVMVLGYILGVTRALDKIISVGSQSNPIIRDQAEAFRNQIREVLVFYMHEAVRSERTTIAAKLRNAGHSELINILG